MVKWGKSFQSQVFPVETTKPEKKGQSNGGRVEQDSTTSKKAPECNTRVHRFTSGSRRGPQSDHEGGEGGENAEKRVTEKKESKPKKQCTKVQNKVSTNYQVTKKTQA